MVKLLLIPLHSQFSTASEATAIPFPSTTAYLTRKIKHAKV